MVGNPSNNNNHNQENRRDQEQQTERTDTLTRITRNHNLRHQVVRELIQGTLDPLIVDPIPTEIAIRDIRVTRDPEGRLQISCQVFYENRDAQ